MAQKSHAGKHDLVLWEGICFMIQYSEQWQCKETHLFWYSVTSYFRFMFLSYSSDSSLWKAIQIYAIQKSLYITLIGNSACLVIKQATGQDHFGHLNWLIEVKMQKLLLGIMVDKGMHTAHCTPKNLAGFNLWCFIQIWYMMVDIALKTGD